MRRETLLDFFEDFASSDDVFLVHDDGYRVQHATYREVANGARRFAARLTAAGIEPNDKVAIWSENRIEWVVALWGCLLVRVVLVPVDFRASADLLARIVTIVAAKAVLVGVEVQPPKVLPAPIWPLAEVSFRTERPSDGTSPSGRGPVATEVRHPDVEVTGDTLAEIIFTSGATADPKGVTITHRNLLANIIPIEREVARYRKYERPFHPIRFLNLLPLSHMFGQSMATFVPPMLEGTVVFSHGYSPGEILHQIKSRRISVLVCVPKVLDVLREHLVRVQPLAAEADVLEGRHFVWRWWRYRSIHRLFGFKFWSIVCGAAPLDADLEAFFRKLGFLVVQGYGLTETAPIVTLNHPFHASQGSVGRPIDGVDVRIGDDGEILVRGENVTSGYFRPDGDGRTVGVESSGAFENGWFHTGDIGELDATGRLVIKGRKKEMIATPQGLKVFPEDVERALLAQPGVRDAGVVGRMVDGEERVHAVLVLTPGTDVDTIIRNANQSLEDHQRVWSTSIWPQDVLPRTEGTQKLKRKELQRWVAGDTAGLSPASTAGATVQDVVARFAAGRTLTSATTFDELGLSSLDRVELLMALEDAFQVTLEESSLAGAKTIADLDALVHPESTPAGTVRDQARRDLSEPFTFPSWNRTRFAWFLRRISLPTWILPLGRVFLKRDVAGWEHLATIRGPGIFSDNHQSLMDVPAIFLSLPARWRYSVAPAMRKEFFRAHFYPREFSRREWFTNSLNYYLSCLFFNTFPLPQHEAGTRQTMRYIGEIIADGYSLLIFPEGEQHATGDIVRFRPGVAMLGTRLDVPIVPVRLDGVDRVLGNDMRWPKRGRVRISFGAPIQLAGQDYQALARQVEEAVRRL